MDGGPFAWFKDNSDTVGLSLVMASLFAFAGALLRNVPYRTLLIGLISAQGLTVITVPTAMIYGNLSWVWGTVIGVVMGLTSIPLMMTLVRFADRLQTRASDIADGAISRVLPNTPPPAPKTGDPP